MPTAITTRRPPAQGVYLRHTTRCHSRQGQGCSCRPRYQAQVWSAADAKPIRKTFPTLAAARAWRADAQTAIHRGAMRAPTHTTLHQAADAFLDGIRAGAIRNRSGDPYKPSVIRGYQASLRLRVLPELGGLKLSAITRHQVQDFADRLLQEGLDPSTVRNTLIPLRVICRRATHRGHIPQNPTTDLELPTPRGRRERIATPTEIQALLAALELADRALWATALYAGLRRGELRALRWEDTDLHNRLIHIRRSWDPKQGAIATKTHAGTRTIPIPATLHALLAQHRARTRDDGYVFTNRSGQPFDPSTACDRARKAWTAAGLQPIGLHECRHTYASLAIAAGINPKALSTYLGHASITITLDRYAHFIPGNQTQAAQQLENYLAGAS